MRLLRSRLFQAALILVVAFVILRFGIRPPAPFSVLSLYMMVVLLSTLVYVSSDSDSWPTAPGSESWPSAPGSDVWPGAQVLGTQTPAPAPTASSLGGFEVPS